MNRRNVLIGLGGIVAGGGALVGTGAFTTVQAERTVNVQTTGDASAFLALVPTNDDQFNETYANGAYAQQTEGTLQINLDGTNSSGEGINKNAVTTIDNIVYVVNNGTQAVTTLNFTLEVTGTGDDTTHENALEITSGNATIAADGGDLLGPSDASDVEDDTLGPGEKVPFGLEVDLLTSSISDFDPDGNATVTLTIEALTS